MTFFVVYVIEPARNTKKIASCNNFRHLKYLLIRSKEVSQMYSVQEVSMMIKIPYSTIKMWLQRHKISTVTGATGQIRITEQGLKEIRSIALVKKQIREIEEQQFGK